MKKLGILILWVIFMTVKIAWSEEIKLADNNWHPETKRLLERLLNANARQSQKVIFDFDNTVVSRDIGDATFACLVKNQQLDKVKIRAISPSFTLPGSGQEISLDNSADLTCYYEKFLLATTHHAGDDSSFFNGYLWITQAMAGLTPCDVIQATRQGYLANSASNDRANGKNTEIEVTADGTRYLAPFFQPEMVDLIGQLLLAGYDVYFVSASNVWTVRYMITVELNGLLRKQFGAPCPAIKPEKVIGVSTLLKDRRTGRLCKDPLLVRETSDQAKAYAALQTEELKNYELTNQPVYPVPVYEGKTANLLKYVVSSWLDRPFLVAGDSAGDFSMLEFAQHRLWLARLEKSDYQEKVTALITSKQLANWFVQPVLCKKAAGFIKNKAQVSTLLPNSPDLPKCEKSWQLLQHHDLLPK